MTYGLDYIIHLWFQHPREPYATVPTHDLIFRA